MITGFAMCLYHSKGKSIYRGGETICPDCYWEAEAKAKAAKESTKSGPPKVEREKEEEAAG